MSWVDSLAIRDGLLAENRELKAEVERLHGLAVCASQERRELRARIEGLEARLRWSEAMREGRMR